MPQTPHEFGYRPLGQAVTLAGCAVAGLAALVGCANVPLTSGHLQRTDVRHVQFRVTEGTALSFDLSPDGRTIVFDLLGQLWTLPAEGGHARAITNAVRDTSEDLDPRFSRDGKRISFRAERGGKDGVWVVATGGGIPRRILDSLPDSRVEWVAGDKMVFTRRIEGSRVPAVGLRVAHVDSGWIRLLPVQSPTGILIRDPAVSRDGQRVAFVQAPRQPGAIVAAPHTHGGPLWEVPIAGGAASALLPDTLKVLAPAYSPDGTQLAFLASDSIRRAQLWIRQRDGSVRRLTSHADLTTAAPRWFPDGHSILYAADGNLWRISTRGGPPLKITFSASVSFSRREPSLPPVRFPDPGAENHARGFMGLALSPDGGRIAMLALGRLWVFAPGAEPASVTDVPANAGGLAWSPDGAEVGYHAGTPGTEDLYAVRVATGETRQLTAFAGREILPLWSPDGRYLAFTRPEMDGNPSSVRLFVVPAQGTRAMDRLDTDPVARLAGIFSVRSIAQMPAWSPDSRALLVYETRGSETSARIVPLSGAPQRLSRFPTAPTFLSWGADGHLVYVHQFRLWRVSFRADSGVVGAPVLVSDEPAIYPSLARNGSLLYVSSDGLRLRRATGEESSLGWPLRYSVAAAPGTILIRNVRVIDGTEAPRSPPKDLLLSAGRIMRVRPAGQIRPSVAQTVIDGNGRTVIPGLINLHFHLNDPAQTAGLLYHGVTSVRDQGSAIARVSGFRDAIASGVWPGPRISFAGFQLSGINPLSLEEASGAVDQDAIARTLSVARGFGADHAKLYHRERWDAAVRVVAQAHSLGMRATGHCAYPLPLVAAGVNSHEHVGECTRRPGRLYYDDIIQLYKAAGIAVVPTMAYFRVVLDVNSDTSLLDQPDAAAFLTPEERAYSQWMKTIDRGVWTTNLARMQTAHSKLRRAGVTIGTGDDISLVKWGVHLEMEELVRIGYSPLEAIAATTGTAARILGADELGTVAEGKLADLVILDADPLDDIRNTRRIWQVIQGGRVIARDRLRPLP